MTSERTIARAADIVAEGWPFGPRLHPCVCGAGRHAHAGSGGTGQHKPTKCRRYRADLAWQLAYDATDAQATSLGHALRRADALERRAHYAANPRAEGEWSIGASDTGTCPKKIQYRNAPPEDFVSAPEDGREARAGTILHEGITTRMRRLYPWREFGTRVELPGLDRKSELDSYDPVTGELEDWKTAGEYRWDVLGDDGPVETVWEQAMLYGYAVEQTGRRVRTIRVSYFRRANGHDESFVREYDEKVAKAALDRLLGYATSLDLGLDLPRTGTGPSTDELCRRCFARIHCWNIPEAEQRGRSPESFTILGAEPTDESIVWAVAEKVEQGKIRLAADKEEKKAKALLDGVEPGRYGDYEGYRKGGGGGDDWKGYAETLGRFYDMPEVQRPALEDIPVPTRPRYSFIQWGRVRKATLEAEARAKVNRPKAVEKSAADQPDVEGTV